MVIIKYVANRAATALEEFFKLESASTILLLLGTVCALLVTNTSSHLADWYHELLHLHIHIQVGNFKIEKHLLHWINDGLMALFFLIVGLELKRELIEGQLSKPSQVILPIIAAIGGMAAPALLYVLVGSGDTTGEMLRGWAIPAATDIAFSLGVIALLMSRVPVSLKIFLMALAIIDDLGAIIIIALFYTNNLDIGMLVSAFAVLAVLIIFNRTRVTNLTLYILVGTVMWYFVLKSGVHATLAGVALAFCIPLETKKVNDKQHNNTTSHHPTHSETLSPLHELEHSLHPWVSFVVIPIFAFANAGVSFEGMTLSTLFSPLPLAIMLGLFFGKQLGIMGTTWLTVKVFKFASLPQDANWWQMYGVSMLCGIGFTMSLFIGGLAFGDNAELMNEVRLGVIAGSIISAFFGFTVLYLSGKPLPTVKSTQ